MVKGVSVSKIEEEKRKTEKWLPYLTKDEKTVSVHKIGNYDIALTNKRVICLKRFPKSLVDAKYESISSLGHSTKIRWSRSIKALIFLVLSVFIYSMSPLRESTVLSDILTDIIKKYLPELAAIPIDKVILLAIIISAGYGVIHLLDFLSSTRGTLRILLKDKGIIKIRTRLTSNVTNLMRAIEERTSTVSAAVSIPAVEPVEELSKDEKLKNVYNRIKKEFNDIGPDMVVLVSAKSEDHLRVIISLLRILLEDKKENGVYISVSRPYEQILKKMKVERIKAENMVFVDCISHMTGKIPEYKGNTVFVENPSSLEEISMYSEKLILRMSSPKFMVIDSISSLLIYNDEKSVKEFIHFMINKMRLESIGGIILSVEKKETEGLVQTLVPMCDSMINV